MLSICFWFEDDKLTHQYHFKVQSFRFYKYTLYILLYRVFLCAKTSQTHKHAQIWNITGRNNISLTIHTVCFDTNIPHKEAEATQDGPDKVTL